MDERLQNAYNFSNYRLTLDATIKVNKLALKNQLIYSKAGGSFVITPELISFVYNLEQMGKTSVVLLDHKENPVRIEDVKEFRETISDQYFSALNEYYVKTVELRKQRSVKAIVGDEDNGAN